MITTPTVIILGAGASMPYGFPSGAELVRQIYSIRGDSFDLLHQASGKCVEDVEEFVSSLKFSQITVDTFLGQRPEFEKIGKTAISMMVAKCEQEIDLYSESIEDNWYPLLYERMLAPFDQFHKNRVGFITFNYDRSLEHFLFNALKHGFGVENEGVAEKLTGIPIIHVHGQMGSLAWQANGSDPVREYSPTPQIKAIRIAAEGIRVISENIDDTLEYRKAHQLLEKSERIFFLGFQYHPENMRRLKIPLKEGKRIFGTCYGFTEEQAGVLSAHKYKGLSLGHVNHKTKEFLRRNQQFFSGE